jgi:hypothetical protein
MAAAGAIGACIGFAYGCALLVWAFWSAGFGHGTYVPAAIICAPISLIARHGPLLAPVWWAVTGWAIGGGSRRLMIALMAVHAASVGLSLVTGTAWASSEELWESLAFVSQRIPDVRRGFTLYLAGQIIAWSYVTLRVAFGTRTPWRNDASDIAADPGTGARRLP